MRKAISLIVVLIILGTCAVPAFALGNGTGTVLYAPMPFDAIYSDLNGGPYEWPFNITNNASDYTATFYLDAVDGNPNMAYVKGHVRNRSGSMLGRLVMAGDCYTLVAKDKVVRVGDSQYVELSLEHGDRFKKLRIYGSYLTFGRSATGELSFFENTFNYTVQMGDKIVNHFNLGDLLVEAIGNEEGFDAGVMYFRELNIDLDVQSATVDTTAFNIYVPRSNLSTIKYSSSQWMNMQVAKFDTKDPEAPTTSEPSAGEIITDIVSSVLDFEIAPGITFTKIFVSVLCVGVVLWFIKIFS